MRDLEISQYDYNLLDRQNSGVFLRRDAFDYIHCQGACFGGLDICIFKNTEKRSTFDHKIATVIGEKKSAQHSVWTFQQQGTFSFVMDRKEDGAGSGRSTYESTQRDLFEGVHGSEWYAYSEKIPFLF